MLLIPSTQLWHCCSESETKIVENSTVLRIHAKSVSIDGAPAPFFCENSTGSKRSALRQEATGMSHEGFPSSSP